MSTLQLVEPPFVPFIGRQNELREATRRLEQMLSDQGVLDCVIFVYGVPMVGKTALLEAIRREASRRSAPSALIDFDREQILNGKRVDSRYDSPEGRVHIVQDLMDQLSHTGELLPASSSLPSVIEPIEAARKLLTYARDLYRFSQRHPFLLMFDTIEDSDPETLLWLQSEIVEKFINEFHTLVVFASRTSPNTTRRDLIYSLERRTEKIHLLPFDEENTGVQIEKMGAGEVLPLPIREFRQYTGGLPGLNDAAARRLAEQKSLESLLPYLVDEIVFKRLAHPLREKDVKAEVLAVSPLRQFDSGLLSRIVQFQWPDRYPQGDFKRIRELISSLQDTRLVESHPDGYGYVIPGELRIVLDSSWQQTQPEKHFQVHQIAAKWFREQVEEGDVVAITDRIYHLGGLQRDILMHLEFKEQLDDELQSDSLVIDRLEGELKGVLEFLQEKSKSTRTFDRTNQIKRILEQPEFYRIFEFEPGKLKQLIRLCEEFNDGL